jgi:hypothetical protein
MGTKMTMDQDQKQYEKWLGPETTKALKKQPSLKTLEKWSNDGFSKATDGCKVEPDGTCPHGCKSWLLALGLI